MADDEIFYLQPFRRRAGDLTPCEPVVARDEDDVFRRGRAMLHRVDGMRFYRIDCSASGDQWTEIELLASVGTTDDEAA